MKNYLRQHALYLCLLAGLELLNLFLALLYLVPMDMFCYSMVLFNLIIVLVIWFDYYRYRHYIQSLDHLIQSHVFTSYDLPEVIHPLEQKLQELAVVSLQRLEKNQEEIEQEKQEQMDYYTLWVHQIKTPIQALSLLLQNEQIDVAGAKAELSKIEQYVTMVLGYQRLLSHQTDYVIKQVRLDDVIHAALRKFSYQFIQKKLKLSYQEVQTEVLTDQKWLTLVLEQILSNAVKYTPEKGEVKIYSENPTTLVIEDNGIGIAEHDRPRLFQKGFTGYNGHEHHHSSGLGLYLSKQIMNRLSHQIRITSSPNQGTKVYLQFDQVELIVE